MKLVFFGTPEFAVLPLKALLDSEHEVIAIVTQPDRRSGRGKHLSVCPVKTEAQNAGLKVIQPEKAENRDFIDVLKTLKPDVIVVAAYGQILPADIIQMPKFGCINIHASLLPKYRGAAPINRAIIQGEEKTGITTMLMDEKMDTGPILLQRETVIGPDDTAGSLSDKLSKIGSDLLLETLEGLKRGDIEPVPQSDGATKAPMIKKADGFIPWERTAREICNFIRGMNPWPAAYGFLDGERIKILKAVPSDYNGGAGVIIGISKDLMLVGSGRGSISIIELQPAGKPVMNIRAFLQGRRLEEGIGFSLNND